jgi:hypothetical protein
MKNTRLFVLLAVVLLLLVASLACKQAGEIITPAEATQRFEATQSVAVSGVAGDAEGAEFLTGSTVMLTSNEFLINLVKSPGDATVTNIFSYAYRGDKVTVEGSVLDDGVIWYRVKTQSGSAWVPEENVVPVEGQ